MSNTPETDAKVSGHIGFYSCATVPADLARRLERQRNEARETTTAAWTENLRLDAENRRLERERDEARKAAQQWRKLYFLQWSIAYDQPLPPEGKPPFPWEESK
jgi:transposase-like protein